MKNIKCCFCHVFCMGNTTFFVFHMKKFAFSTSKKSANLLEIRPKLLIIWNFDVFLLILLFFEIFRRGKISQKKLMKQKWEMQKNASKLNAIFIVLDAKFCKYFFIFLKFSLFWTKWCIYFWNLVGKSLRNLHLKKTFKKKPFAFFLKRSVGVKQFFYNLHQILRFLYLSIKKVYSYIHCGALKKQRMKFERLFTYASF